MFKELKNLLFYASIGKENYQNIRPRIDEYNRHSLVVYTSVATSLVTIFFILSFFIEILESSRATYLFCSVISIILLAIAKGPAKNNLMLSNISLNIFECMLLAIGIYLGTVVDPYQASMSFAILMFATPLLFASTPWAINLLTLTSIIIYTIAASQTQDAHMFAFNLSCIYPFGAINVIVTTFIRRMKITTFFYRFKAETVDQITALNKQLEDANKAAEASNRAKTVFLNNMSHDIRTPMNAILGFTELMKTRTDEPEVIANYLQKIEGSGQYLLTIINNVLDLARIDSGKTEIDEEILDMTNENISVMPMFNSLLKQKNLEFYCSQNIQHKYLWCDISKINQIMVNLLSNAVKYTPEGGRISYTVEELPSNREGYAKFVTKVSDNGIGMSKEFIEHVFDDFTRERDTTHSKIGGTGLGMSIVKRLVNLLGYEITVESELGKGTTFAVTSFMKIVENPDEFICKNNVDVSDNNSLAGKRILLAEDNELNAEIAIAILEDNGMTVEHAKDGVDCVKMLTEKSAGYYDAILMDIQMPNLNGYAATKKIRHLDDKSKASIPILAMTANAFEEDKRIAFNVGMNAHISKPINVSELMQHLAEVLE